jgi:ribose transport system permease protein
MAPARIATRLPHPGPTLRAFAVLVVLLAIYAWVQPPLFASSTFTTLLDESMVVALAAVGETIVVMAGGFDLSVGAALSVVNVVLATHAWGSTAGQIAMIPVGIGVGVGIGLVNGLLVAVLRIPSIAATLATSFLWGGVALLILSQPGGAIPFGFVGWFTADWGSVPSATAVLLFAAAAWLVLKRTRFGRAIYSIGGNPTAAAINGIDVRRTAVGAYAAGGFFYGLAGVFLSAESASGDPNIGAPVLLTVFAAVVVGGTPFGGGRGDALGSIAGAFILTLIGNVLFALGVSSFYTNIFNGGVLVLAVLASSVTSGWFAPLRRLAGARRRRAGLAGAGG